MTTIRRVNGATFEFVIRDLQLEVLPDDKPMSTDAGDWWLAYDGTTPVGFAGLTKSTQWIDCSYLCRAGVIESHRGKGLQKRLIAVREQHARRAGMAWVITDTLNNPASANSLISSGYRIYEPGRPWGLRGALYWRKNLRKHR